MAKKRISKSNVNKNKNKNVNNIKININTTKKRKSTTRTKQAVSQKPQQTVINNIPTPSYDNYNLVNELRKFKNELDETRKVKAFENVNAPIANGLTHTITQTQPNVTEQAVKVEIPKPKPILSDETIRINVPAMKPLVSEQPSYIKIPNMPSQEPMKATFIKPKIIDNNYIETKMPPKLTPKPPPVNNSKQMSRPNVSHFIEQTPVTATKLDFEDSNVDTVPITAFKTRGLPSDDESHYGDSETDSVKEYNDFMNELLYIRYKNNDKTIPLTTEQRAKLKKLIKNKRKASKITTVGKAIDAIEEDY